MKLFRASCITSWRLKRRVCMLACWASKECPHSLTPGPPLSSKKAMESFTHCAILTLTLGTPSFAFKDPGDYTGHTQISRTLTLFQGQVLSSLNPPTTLIPLHLVMLPIHRFQEGEGGPLWEVIIMPTTIDNRSKLVQLDLCYQCWEKDINLHFWTEKGKHRVWEFANIHLGSKRGISFRIKRI